jgi:geranylgeranyl diphosphate synthase type II
VQTLGRIERTLAEAIESSLSTDSPPRLVAAVRHAVFPGGARVRPRLCLAVAHACGLDDPVLAAAGAAAVELLHCASLVHDDLPCFDDAALRRGHPSVHRAFGERLAILAGDALIVLAFQTIARAKARCVTRIAPLIGAVAAGAGLPAGIVAGQAWECEPRVSVREYHRAKTGALFAAATQAGALASGANPATWRPLGERLGEAYQVADDIRDACGSVQWLGKPAGRDAALGRPSVAAELSLQVAMPLFERLIGEAQRAVPEGVGAAPLRQLLRAEAQRLIPPALADELLASAA